jgi:hypothetical protein
MWREWEEEKFVQYFDGIKTEGDLLEDLGIDLRIILEKGLKETGLETVAHDTEKQRAVVNVVMCLGVS